jgi:RHS repeat-associated protein
MISEIQRKPDPILLVANNGNIHIQTITVPGMAYPLIQNYTYDSLNRLSTAAETSNSIQAWKQSFTFDRYGNRNFDRANTTMPASFANPAVSDPTISTTNNRITSTGWLYDSAGNTTRDGEYGTFAYDGENKQVLVKNSLNVTRGEYFYDGDGKRVKKRAYDPSGILSEETIFVYDAAGKQIAEYSTNVAAVQNAEVAYLTNDHLGSPRINTDRDGNVTSRHDYHPFGEEIMTNERSSHPQYTPDSVRKQFTGYERDGETDLDFAQARYYGKTLGRFYSPDPLLESANRVQPQSWNRYIYAINNPLRYVDPEGEDYEDLTEKQKKLIDAWAVKQNAEKETEISAKDMYDALDTSQRGTFEANANALENTTIIGKDGTKMNGLDIIKSINFIRGETPASKDNPQRFRLLVELQDGASDFIKTATNFKAVNASKHKGFPVSRQLKGGEPSIQISMTNDGKSADIDVDYESKSIVTNIFNGCKHCGPENSDVRHSDHFEKHNGRFGKGSAGPLRRKYEPKPPK